MFNKKRFFGIIIIVSLYASITCALTLTIMQFSNKHSLEFIDSLGGYTDKFTYIKGDPALIVNDTYQSKLSFATEHDENPKCLMVFPHEIPNDSLFFY